MGKVKRPALRYPGAKWNLAPWIIKHFPSAASYCESYGGSLAVLLQKPRHKIETVNDLNGRVTNYFKQLRENTDELVRQIKLTPWARREYDLAHMVSDCPLEDARRFFMFCWMGIGGGSRYKSGWRVVKNGTDRFTKPALDTVNVDHLYQVADRLVGVQIENEEAEKVAKRYDTPTTLHYIDPPYPLETRKGLIYEYELSGNDEHGLLSLWVKRLTGYVVLSGYAHLKDGAPNQLYADLYESVGWVRIDREARTNGNGKRTESLWLSPRTSVALFSRYSDMPIFSGIVK